MGSPGDQGPRSGAKVDRSQSCKIDKKDPKVKKKQLSAFLLVQSKVNSKHIFNQGNMYIQVNATFLNLKDRLKIMQP
jgi:hypothetical protein